MTHKFTFEAPALPAWSVIPGVKFGHFLTLIPSDGFDKIEATVPHLTSPNHSFRQALIGILWRFYHRAREADAMVSRAVVKRELQIASLLAAVLKTSVGGLSNSSEPAVVDALYPFVFMLDAGGRHPSGIDLIDVLDRLARNLEQANGSLADDIGGRRPAAAFDLLMKELWEWRRNWAEEHTRGSHFEFLKAIFEVLRETERELQNAERELGLALTSFNLPNSREALQRRMYPRTPRKARRH